MSSEEIKVLVEFVKLVSELDKKGDKENVNSLLRLALGNEKQK